MTLRARNPPGQIRKSGQYPESSEMRGTSNSHGELGFGRMPKERGSNLRVLSHRRFRLSILNYTKNIYTLYP